MIFDRVVQLAPWSDEKIGELMRARSDAIGITPSFRRLAARGIPGRAVLPEDLDQAERGFYRMLWDLADGNPGVALEIWRNSLYIGAGANDGSAEVRFFEEPSAADIERLPLSSLFVLRAIVQLERAAIDDIVECTRLPPAEVHECVSFCLARGYVEPLEDRVRISWPWFRTITRVLARQHLLAW